MESSEVSFYCNEIAIALKTQNVYFDRVFYEKDFCDLFGSLFWMRYEIKVGIFFYVLEILDSIGRIV